MVVVRLPKQSPTTTPESLRGSGRRDVAERDLWLSTTRQPPSVSRMSLFRDIVDLRISLFRDMALIVNGPERSCGTTFGVSAQNRVLI